MKRGQMLIAAIFVVIIISLLILEAVSLLSTQSFSEVKNFHGIQALNVAEGGIRFTIATSLAADSDWSDNVDFGPVTLNPGVFSVHYISKAKKSCSLEVTGTVQGVSRVVRLGAGKGGIPYQFSDYVGYGGRIGATGNELLFNNNARCYGNLYYYGPIRFTSNSQQSGGVVKSASIDPLPAIGIPTNYASWEQISTCEPISFDPSYYQSWITMAASNDSGTVLSQNSGTINLSSYPNRTYFRRGFVLSGTVVINGPGTICATGATATANYGAFRVTGSVKINGNVRIISRGNAGGGANLRAVKINPTAGNTVFNTTIEVIAQTFIDMNSTTTLSPESVLYVDSNDGSGYAIRARLNNPILRGTLVAPNGVIRLENSATMEGRMYSDSLWMSNTSRFYGSSWSFKNVLYGSQIQDFATLIQTQEGMPQIPVPGLATLESGSSLEVFGWGEVY